MSTLVRFTADVNAKTDVLPRYVVGGKYYSFYASQYIRNSTLKTRDGKITKDAIAELGLDMICQSQARTAGDDASGGDNWNAIKGLSFYNADLLGSGLSPHFIIGTANPYNGGYTSAPSRGGGFPSPEEAGVDATGIGNVRSPEYFWTNGVKPYLDHVAGDLARLVSVELCNEPETMTQAQLGQSDAWYRTDALANLRFIANQSRRYANYFEAQQAGLRAKVFSSSLSNGSLNGRSTQLVGGTGINDGSEHNERMINGYTDFGGWRWGSPAGTKNDPNTLYLGGFSQHGYFMPSAGLAGAGSGNWQDVTNLMLYDGSDADSLVTLTNGQWKMPKGNHIPAARKFRAKLDAAALGAACKTAWTEMWPWSSADAMLPLMDAGQLIATLQNWNAWKVSGYFFAGINVSPGTSPGVITADSMFADYGGLILRSPRAQFLKYFGTMFNGVRGAPKNVCPAAVVTRKGPAGNYSNPIDAVWAFQTMSDDNTTGRYFLWCSDSVTPEDTIVTFVDRNGLPRTALQVTATIMDKTLPTDSSSQSNDPVSWWTQQHGAPFAPPLQNSGNAGGTNDSVRFTMPAPSAVRLDVTFQGGTVTPTAPQNTGLPSIAGVPQQAQVLTGSDGNWTGDTSRTRAWWRCDSLGAKLVQVGSAQTYTVQAGDVGYTLRFEVTATNANGSTTAISAPTGSIGPTVTGGAPTVDAVATPNTVNGGLSVALTFTVAADANGILVHITDAFASDIHDVKAQASGGVAQAMTLLANKQAPANGVTGAVYEIVGPNTPTGTVTITATFNTGRTAILEAISVKGVDPNDPFELTSGVGYGFSTTSTASPSASTTSVTGELCLGFLSGRHTLAALTVTDAQTSRDDKDYLKSGTDHIHAHTSSKASAASTTSLSWTWSVSPNAGSVAIVVALKPKPAVAPTNTAAPSIDGVPKVGEVITLTRGNWSDSDSQVENWQHDNSGAGTVWTDEGDNDLTYTVQASDVGDLIRVHEVASNSLSGLSTDAYSNTLGPVVSANPKAVTIVDAFDAYGDDANRPDEDPTSQYGNWGAAAQSGVQSVRVVSRRFASHAGGADSQSTFLPVNAANVDVYCRMLSMGANGFGIWPRVQNPGNATTMKAYDVVAGPTGFTIYKVTGGGSSFVNSASQAYTLSPFEYVRVTIDGTNTIRVYSAFANTDGTFTWGAPKLTWQDTSSPITGAGITQLEIGDGTTLVDDWHAQPLSTLWADVYDVQEKLETLNGQVRMTPRVNAVVERRSAAFVDYTGSRFTIAVCNPGNQAGGNVFTWVQANLDDSNLFGFLFSNGQVQAGRMVANKYTAIGAPVAYNAATMKWFQLREDGAGNVLFEYSDTYAKVINPANATVLASIATASIGFSLGLLQPRFGCQAGTSAVDPGVPAFDCVNVAPSTPSLMTDPVVTGGGHIGETLTTTDGTYLVTPTSVFYQWYRDLVPIAGATASTYTPVNADGGHTLTVRVAAQNASGATLWWSNGIAVSSGPSNLTPPVIAGGPTVGNTLSYGGDTWGGSPTSFLRQWYRQATDGSLSPIQGATAATYPLVDADDGYKILVGVIGVPATGSPSPEALSAPVGPVVEPAPVNTVSPSIASSPIVGNTLIVDPGTWLNMNGVGAYFSYQWYRYDAAGLNPVLIPGATTASYTVQAADVGHRLGADVSAHNSGSA